MDVRVSAVVRRLCEVPWDWNDLERSLSAAAFTRQEEVLGRTTIASDGVRADVHFFEGTPLDVEITLSAIDVAELTPLEYEDTIDECYATFNRDVDSIAAFLGDPVFVDGAGADTFPEDQEALFLALWLIVNARLMLQMKHDDRELPVRLCVVVAPPAS